MIIAAPVGNMADTAHVYVMRTQSVAPPCEFVCGSDDNYATSPPGPIAAAATPPQKRPPRWTLRGWFAAFMRFSPL